jgi:hypothetical protein
MKKRLSMSIKLSLPKRDLKVEKVSKTKKQLLEIIEKHVSTVNEHFKPEYNPGGWKLDKDFVQSEILRDIFGFHIEDEISQAFMNEGLVIEYSNNMSLIRTKEEYHPIYMNAKTGKLYVIENSDDKSYLNKFKESKGYFEIGAL